MSALAASSHRLTARWVQAQRAVGDCYEANGKYFLFERPGDKSLVLVHGEVTGTGGAIEGLNYGHAWIEDGGTVLDFSNGRSTKTPKALYYATGRIKENGNMHRYTYHQAAVAAAMYGVWGPWDLVTSTGY